MGRRKSGQGSVHIAEISATSTMHILNHPKMVLLLRKGSFVQQIFRLHSSTGDVLHKLVVELNSFAIGLRNKSAMWRKLQLCAYYPKLYRFRIVYLVFRYFPINSNF
jgi:hypothetical protein